MFIYELLNKNVNIYPIFGENKIKNPVFLSMAEDSTWIKNLEKQDIINQEKYNNKIIEFGEKNNADLIISGYLEERKILFETLGCEQMLSEKRFYHLGVDFSMPVFTDIYAPLDGKIVISEYEEGEGNYGGFFVIKHNLNNNVFYSLYGHQNVDSLPKVGQKVIAGDKISKLGDYSENGGYFHHLHLQVFTQSGFDGGFLNKGYIREDEIKTINKYCPDPSFLFRY